MICSIKMTSVAAATLVLIVVTSCVTNEKHYDYDLSGINTILETDETGARLGGDSTDWRPPAGSDLQFFLDPAYPNPVSELGSTTIDFGIEHECDVKIIVVNDNCETVFSWEAVAAPGCYSLTWDVEEEAVSAGYYRCFMIIEDDIFSYGDVQIVEQGE